MICIYYNQFFSKLFFWCMSFFPLTSCMTDSNTIFAVLKNVAEETEEKHEKENSRLFVTWWIGDDSLETCDFLPWRVHLTCIARLIRHMSNHTIGIIMRISNKLKYLFKPCCADTDSWRNAKNEIQVYIWLSLTRLCVGS